MNLNIVLCLTITFVVHFTVVAARLAEESLNIYGRTLMPCSGTGMAMTGYMRDGTCGSTRGDSGSHHICIDLSSVKGGNFCTVTNQWDWCSGSSPCHDDASKTCPMKNWCVCQWAFANYVRDAGGCANIQDIVCESVNINAADAYSSSTAHDHKVALACLQSRCGI